MTTATATAGVMSRADIEAKIVKRCWTDEAFRDELLADPVACFVKYTGLTADKAPAIVVHEESGRDWHIVIPAKPARAGELSDADLERVAGGTDVVIATVVGSVAATIMGASILLSAAASAGTVSIVSYIEEKGGW